jgi:HEPN domain-containing protein
MNNLPPRQREYVAWQNRATDFYVAARHLFSSEMTRPAAYSAAISLELLLKATLIYWDKTFNPTEAAHGMAKLCRIVGNKVPGAKGFRVPTYFYHEKRYLTVTRYPTGGKGVGIPGRLLSDLDAAFAKLISLVPFQHNTNLKRVLRGKLPHHLAALRAKNANFRALKRLLLKGSA